MYLYQNKSKTAVVLVNHKVCSTSLKSHCDAGEIDKIANASLEYRKVAQDPLFYKMIIARHPCSKIESFYKDLFLSEIHDGACGLTRSLIPGTFEEFDEILDSQSSLETYICIHTGKLKSRTSTGGLPFWVQLAAETCQYFTPKDYFNKNISFERFIIEGIKKGYDGKGHLWEQTRVLERCQLTASDLDEIIKLEVPDFKNLNHYFNINLVHKNKSSSKTSLIWTPEMKQIIYEKYKKDFEEFDYKA